MPRLSIAIDCSPAAVPEPLGVAVYIRGLVRGLAEVDAETRYFLCHRLSRLRRASHLVRPPGPNFRRKLIQEPFHPFFSRRLDLFHGADTRLPRGFAGVPKVATVHDLFSLAPDGFFSDEAFRAKRLRQYDAAAREAAAVIGHSAHVRDQVVRRLGVPRERVFAVPLAPDPAHRPRSEAEVAPVRERHGLPARYVLAVGLLSRRKDPVAAIRALAGLGDRTIVLALAGRDADAAAAARAEAARPGIEGRVRFLGYVPAPDLALLYAGARALLFPSRDEGFGLPVLEAMASGTPVVAAARGAIPEVAGDAAALVDPDDPTAVAAALSEAVEDGPGRRTLVERGRERAGGFTWTRTARETLAVYRAALAPSRVAP